jgi:hypothetical protein
MMFHGVSLYTALILTGLTVISTMNYWTPCIVSMRAPGSVIQRIKGLLPATRNDWGFEGANDKSDGGDEGANDKRERGNEIKNRSSSTERTETSLETWQSSFQGSLGNLQEEVRALMNGADESSGNAGVDRLHLWRFNENGDDVADVDKAARDLREQIYTAAKLLWSEYQLSVKEDKNASVNVLMPGVALLEDTIVGVFAPLSFRFLALLLCDDKDLLKQMTKSLEKEIGVRTQYWLDAKAERTAT